MTTIIANMVVRNEADAYLPQVLDRLSEQVDLICVTDDASDDSTLDLLAKYPKVRSQVMPEPTFRVHEGRLRQASWDFLSQHVTDDDTMILAIDADEELYETQYALRDLAAIGSLDVFNINFFHMWNETEFRVDGGWRPHGSSRFFRYQPGGQFADRQMACGSEPTYVQHLIRMRKYFVPTGLMMKHLSYIKDEDKRKKYDRYVELDGGAFHAGPHIQSIIDPPERVTLQPWSSIVNE